MILICMIIQQSKEQAGYQRSGYMLIKFIAVERAEPVEDKPVPVCGPYTFSVKLFQIHDVFY